LRRYTKERPDLAEEKNQLIIQGAANKKQLKVGRCRLVDPIKPTLKAPGLNLLKLS
jgi:hypothetical protein